MPLVEFKKICKSFKTGDKETVICDNFDLAVEKGPNGAKNFTLSQDFLLYPSVLQNLLIYFRKLCTLHDKDNRRCRPMGQV